MATLTSKITLSSPNITSDSLNISTSNNLTISKDVQIKRVQVSTSSVAVVLAASFTRAWIFVKNIDSSITINLTKSNGGDHYMTLLAGECAFFPWETSVDLYADVASGTPTLEYMIFEV
tara:strand:+ start:159 stop:515 length:357 start_codon:yes stop_codon:yes gene_type:complete